MQEKIRERISREKKNSKENRGETTGKKSLEPTASENFLDLTPKA